MRMMRGAKEEERGGVGREGRRRKRGMRMKKERAGKGKETDVRKYVGVKW